jgi:hypothetical protein
MENKKENWQKKEMEEKNVAKNKKVFHKNLKKQEKTIRGANLLH